MGRRLTEDESRKLDADETRAKLHDQWAKSYLGPHGAPFITADEARERFESCSEKGCELPSGDNLRPGDVVHLRAKFLRPSDFAPTTHGVFDIGGLVQFSPFAEIVDVELPPLKAGDRVVTPDGIRGTVVDLIDGAPDIAWLDLGVDYYGHQHYRRVSVDTLTRAD